MSIVYFLLGSLVPLPVFYNLLTGEVLVQRASLDNYLTSFGVPVPVGMFSVLLMGIVALVSQFLKLRGVKSINKKLSGGIIVLVCFFVYSTYFLEVPRIISLIFSSISLLFVYLYIKSSSLFYYSMRGYMFSIFVLVFLHVISIVVFESGGLENNTLLFSSFYGYSIYQALISYSAVLSFLGCTLIVLLFSPVGGVKKVVYIIMIAGTFYVLSYGMRKAVILDMIILFCSFGLFGFLSLSVRYSIPASYFKAMIFIMFAIGCLILLSGFSERDLSLGGAIVQRESDYVKFLDLLNNSTLSDIIFGFGGGWGGAHNLFLVMIMRLGIAGLILFLVPLYLLFRIVSAQPFFHFMEKYRVRYCVKEKRVWVVFLVVSIIASNSVNSNLQLPYYVLNVLFISLAYFRESRLQNI